MNSTVLRFFILFGLACTHDVLAWGNLGHRVTGHIAEALLTPGASKQVQQLLGEEPLAVATTYMDTQRAALSERWPAAEKWHYDNRPVCHKQVDYCADGNCATQQLESFRKVLADKTAPRDERALALRLLIHMIGDIHQPLHMADNADRGGNNLQVRLYAGGQRYRLHEVLDTVLLRDMLGQQRVNAYADNLRQRYQAQLRGWQPGSWQSWSQQTYRLGMTQVYGALPGFVCGGRLDKTLTLPDSYVQNARQYVPEQLTKAGVRIAAVLNATLK